VNFSKIVTVSIRTVNDSRAKYLIWMASYGVTNWLACQYKVLEHYTITDYLAGTGVSDSQEKVYTKGNRSYFNKTS